MKRRIVVSGIGTGGHYFPALVVAQALADRQRNVSFLVRPRGPEDRAARSFNVPSFPVPASGFYGKTPWAKARFVGNLIRATMRLLPLTKKAVGVAFGGYGSLSLILSCLINRRPFYLFEPNRVPGRATRLFARRARRVFLGLPLSRPIPGPIMFTGVPIRREFKAPAQGARTGVSAKIVLIVGGSQGARRLNQLGIELQTELPKGYRIRIISGERDYQWVDQHRNGRTDVIPFTATPWAEFRDSDVIISRSGALAGYEIMAAGKNTVFVPFPHAVDNHQFHNAQYFAAVGGGLVLEEHGLTAKILAETIQKLCGRRSAPPRDMILDAEQRIADAILGDISTEESNAG